MEEEGLEIPEFTPQQQFEFTLASNTNLILNCLSIACGLITVVLILILSYVNRIRMNRVSLRFTLAIALMDAIRAGIFISYTNYHEDTVYCSLIAYGLFSSTLLYLFLTVAIAVNLELVFLHERAFQRRWEWWYWIISVGLGLLIPSIPLFSGRFGLDSETFACDYIDSQSQASYIWLWSTYTIWVILACVYCFVIVLAVVFNLCKKVTVINRVEDSSKPRHRETVKQNANYVRTSIKSLILRVSLYCIIPIVTQTLSVIYRELEHHVEDPGFVLNYTSLIMTDLPGILNLIAFLCDPAFHNALKSLGNSHSNPAITKSTRTSISNRPLYSPPNYKTPSILLTPQCRNSQSTDVNPSSVLLNDPNASPSPESTSPPGRISYSKFIRGL